MYSNEHVFKKQEISKENILQNYSKLRPFFKSVINFLYGEQIPSLGTLGINVCDYKKDKKKLTEWDKKTGVYIFIENNCPVYIGKAGTKKMNFLKRIDQEISEYKGNNSQTLSKNIIFKEKIFGNGCNSIDSVKKINTFNLLFISCGRKKIDVNRTNELESLLIALFHPKYNNK